MSSTRHILVVGAGVTGLTTALFLAQAGYKVTVVAEHYPGDSSAVYASPWAGAHWRTSATSAETEVCDWDVQTYQWWVDIINEERMRPNLPRSSLKMQDSYGFYDEKPREKEWWAPHVQQFRELPASNAEIAAINSGVSEKGPRLAYGEVHCAMSLDSSRYIKWLQEKAILRGVHFLRSALPGDGGLGNLLDAAQTVLHIHGLSAADAFVNATGISARKLCSDEKVHPIKGQTVVVKGEAKATRTRLGAGYISYCIPRPGSGTSILGGTKVKGDWSTSIDDETTRSILERVDRLAPELKTSVDGGFEVISVQCGLRPGRTGGPRVEMETVGKHQVVHSYGHGSGGFQNSAGSARKVVQLIEECVGGPGKLLKAKI
ncbi:hypothetical protein Q7P37_002908 [Cladosporium fusiforme]